MSNSQQIRENIETNEITQTDKIKDQINDLNNLMNIVSNINADSFNDILAETNNDIRQQRLKKHLKDMNRDNKRILAAVKSIAIHSGQNTNKIDSLIQSIEMDDSDE